MKTAMSKACTKCGEVKSLSEFGFRKAVKDGRMSACRVCINRVAREYTLKNPAKRQQAWAKWRGKNRDKLLAYGVKRRQEKAEYLREKAKESYHKNREKRIEQMRQYRKTSHDKFMASIHRWRDKNPEKVREAKRRWQHKYSEQFKVKMRRWYEANREKVAEDTKAYRQKNKARLWQARKRHLASDPSFRIGVAFRSMVSTVLKRHGGKKTHKAEDLLGCSIHHLREHLERQFRDGMTWSNYGKWHVDHIRPCASFDLTEPTQQKQCFHFSNLQPLWGKENISKGAKWKL